jgi:hypothetical protein
MGALACTGYCVSQGQDPWTALQITVAATVTGLVSCCLHLPKLLTSHSELVLAVLGLVDVVCYM